MNDDIEPLREPRDRPAETGRRIHATQIHASTGLNRARTARLIARALEDGQQPAEIAEECDIPTDVVDDVTRQVRTGRDYESVRPAEIINMYAAGEITGRTALWRLVCMTYAAGQHASPDDRAPLEDWDEIKSAFARGLINERQYNWLLANCDFAGKGRGWSADPPRRREGILEYGLFGEDLMGFVEAAELEVKRLLEDTRRSSGDDWVYWGPW